MMENIATQQEMTVVGEVETAEDMEARAKKENMMAALASELNTNLGKAIADRTPIETRMLSDEAQYWGRVNRGYDTKDDVSSTGNNTSTDSNLGKATDNKTRSKTRIAAARISDMLFPTNSPNWAIRPTPYPDVPIPLIMEEYNLEMAEQQAAMPPPDPQQALMGGQANPEEMMGMPPEGDPSMPPAPQQPEAPPPPEPDYEVLANKVAVKRARKMTARIRDVLVENNYAKNGRQAIFDGCKVGTGIMKGPYVRFQTRRSYENVEDEQGSVAKVNVEKVEIPGVARVSPWMWYPLQSRCVDECEGSYELHILTKTQLRKMIKTHGFYPEPVNRVMKTKPSLGSIESVMAQRATITNYSMSRYENSYAVWEYQGVLDADVLRTMGFELEEDDDITAYYGAAWFVDHEIIRIDMAPLEAESKLPYNVWCYEDDETNVFGFGVPFVMREDQYVIDMIWTAILHNTSVSAGPQIAIEKGCLIPADKSYNITGPKLWYKNDVDVPMKQAIEAFVIPSTVASTMPVYQQALQNADTNTNLPLMLGDGQASQSQQGLSGAAQITVMNQTNIVQRQAAHSWDDNVTDPLITGLYHWFMQSTRPEDEEAKGDYQVEARGASHLLVKDTQAQHAQMLLQMASTDPTLANMLNLDELYRIYLAFLDISVDALMKSPEQIKADEANQQPDPVQTAEIAKLESETRLNDARAQKEAQPDTREQDLNVVDHAEIMKLELEYAKMQDKERDREHDMQKELIRRETKLMEIASKEGVEYEKMNNQISSDREKLLADLSDKKTKQRSQDYFDAARLRLDQYTAELQANNLSKGYDTFG